MAALASDLGVSASTIRRDLHALDAGGSVRRIRGGAGTIEADEVPFSEVDTVAAREKDAIARRAAELVGPGDVVLLDIGTTTARLARHLRGRRITVITSSLAVVDELRDDDVVEVLVLGGILRRNYLSMVGMLTEDAVRQIRAHRLFLGTSGVRRDGRIMDTTVVEVPVKRAMIAVAEQVIVLADKGKFPGSGLLPVCGPDDVDVVVTNVGADAETVAVLERANTEVLQT